MVKLTLAREVQMYGSDPTRNIWEFINSYLYILATILLSCGFGLQLLSGQGEPIAKPSLIVILIGIVLVVAVNTYDLMAHMVGVSLVGLDTHMVLVQLAVPVVHAVGAVLTFIGILLTQTESRGNNKQDAAKVLVVGPLLWLFATLYEMCLCWKARDSKVDLRRKSVQVPFLMGTTLFIMGGHVYQMYLSGPQQDLETFPGQWLWLCTLGSSYFLMGGLHNLEYNMQQMN